MDINVLLANIRAYHAEWLSMGQEERVQAIETYGDDFSEMLINLDNWLSSGGFLPTDWASARVTHER